MLLTFRNERQKAAVVFIHGLYGDPEASWKNFRELLIADPRTKGWDCFSFGYKSSRKQLTVVAHDFYLALTSTPLVSYEQVAIVAHSTGGTIAQIAVLHSEDLLKRISHIFFFALP